MTSTLPVDSIQGFVLLNGMEIIGTVSSETEDVYHLKSVVGVMVSIQGNQVRVSYMPFSHIAETTDNNLVTKELTLPKRSVLTPVEVKDGIKNNYLSMRSNIQIVSGSPELNIQ